MPSEGNRGAPTPRPRVLALSAATRSLARPLARWQVLGGLGPEGDAEPAPQLALPEAHGAYGHHVRPAELGQHPLPAAALGLWRRRGAHHAQAHARMRACAHNTAPRSPARVRTQPHLPRSKPGVHSAHCQLCIAYGRGCLALLSSRRRARQGAAYGVTTAFTNCASSVSLALYIAVSVRTGTLLGEGKPHRAKQVIRRSTRPVQV